jgi:hypothetical protein
MATLREEEERMVLLREEEGKAMCVNSLLAGLTEGDGAVRVAPDGEDESRDSSPHQRRLP